MKSYTDLEQSRKLTEILSLETADMYYYSYMSIGELFYTSYPNVIEDKQKLTKNDIPSWSLSALLGVLPQGEYKDADLCFGGYKGDEYIPEWFCSYEQQEPFIIEICHADNPVDACYELILKLHELKML